jgi:hypothetical protein
MHMRRIILRVMLGVALLVPCARAQSGTPTITAGELIPLTLKSEMPVENVMTGSFDVGTSYDDNVLFGSPNRVGDWSYIFRPRFRIGLSTSRLSLSYYLSPWLVKFQTVDARDEFTTDSGFDVNYRFTPHVSLRVREAFIYTDHVDFGSQNTDSSTASGTGAPNLLDPGNGVVFIPFARRLSTLTDVVLTDQISPQSEIQASGDFYLLRLHNIANVSLFPFVNTQSAGARALYFYHVTPRQSIGLMYDFQDYSFEQEGSARNLVHTVFYVHDLQFSERQSLEGFIGPQYSNVSTAGGAGAGGGSLLPQGTSSEVTWAGGLVYGWQGVNTKIRMSVLRDIGAGEGVLGAVEREQATIEGRRQLSSRLIGSIGVGYERNNSLFNSAVIGTLDSFFGSAGLIYKISEGWRVEARYFRNQQSQSGTINRLLAGDRDMVEFTVGYQFRHPLGR